MMLMMIDDADGRGAPLMEPKRLADGCRWTRVAIAHTACHRSPFEIRSGYRVQTALLAKHIERLVGSFEAARQSIIMEGVHLDVSSVIAVIASDCRSSRELITGDD